MNAAPFPRAQHGGVLAGVKATPCGWPTASPDTGSGRRRLAANGSRARRPRSTNFRSLRFQGIAEQAFQPEDLSRFIVERLNAGDVDGLVALYEPDAVLAVGRGHVASGAGEIRTAHQQIVAGRPTVEPGVQQAALRRGDLALTSSRLADGTITAEVARRQPDGTWLWMLDQPNING
jgi:ketosteroid isomerase-like protein